VSTPAVSTTDLTRDFDSLRAVNGINLRIEPGEIYGLLGPDGAGKTTLIRMLATVLRPTSGEAEVCGYPVSHPNQITPLIGYMSQKFCMYPDLSVAENLEFFGTVRGVSRADRAERSERLLVGMGLERFTARQAQFLSGGMKQKLMLAATLMHEPDLLLLDEPTTGVDPVSRREFWSILGELHASGKTVIVATPYMDEAARCTRVGFLENGQITTSGTPAEITSRVPGTLVEISGPARAALAALNGDSRSLSAHLHGDVARVLWSSGNAEAEVAAALRGLPNVEVRRVDVDMEAAFAFLAQTGLAL
jgi:ABC-2 type transport system ATP-binding protein